ncbi:MAG TPA: inositol monophosphatase family protein [Dongiaceae bacterium]|jgi:myo-inositol-1(or 4)-monophosphatase
MASRSATVNVMIRAAEKAAKRLRRDFGEVEHLQVSVKGPGDFVSNADLRAEKTLREELHKARPDYGFVLEEGGVEKGADPNHRWHVDPLDGTTNFLHSIPHFAISIGLERDGEVIAGVVYDPIKEELFWAEKGVGAYLNDRRLRVSGRRKLGESVVATGLTPRNRAKDEERQQFVAQLDTVVAATAGLRRFGSAALDLAYVAAGRYDAFWENELASWDIAAGMCLVREAGGFVTEINGGPNALKTGSTLACNVHLYPSFKKLLSEAAKPR